MNMKVFDEGRERDQSTFPNKANPGSCHSPAHVGWLGVRWSVKPSKAKVANLSVADRGPCSYQFSSPILSFVVFFFASKFLFNLLG